MRKEDNDQGQLTQCKACRNGKNALTAQNKLNHTMDTSQMMTGNFIQWNKNKLTYNQHDMLKEKLRKQKTQRRKI